MSENIAYKFGGTSNNTAETIMRCIEIGGDGIAMTVSAPGALSDKQLQRFGDYSHIPEEIMRDKVTNNSLAAYALYHQTGELDPMYVDAVTARYAVNVQDLGLKKLQGGWVRDIAHRMEEAVKSPTLHRASMLGEQLEAEVFEQMGFFRLDPAEAKLPLFDNPVMWDRWLIDFDRRLGRIVMGGNITTNGTEPWTVGRGGSDATGSLLARALGARENHIVSNYPLYSFDPGEVGTASARHVPDITYYEAGDLHETGTKTFHHAGIPPMVNSGIPTMAYSIDDPNGPRTIYTDDLIDSKRSGRVIAMSLMDVDVLSVFEPGMSSRHGRIAEISAAIKAQNVNIEHIGDFGSYGITIVLDANAEKDKNGVHDTDKAEAALRRIASENGEVLREKQAMVTAVGHGIIKSSTQIDSVLGPITDRYTRENPHRFEGPHAKRITVDRKHGKTALIEAHRALIEDVA